MSDLRESGLNPYLHSNMVRFIIEQAAQRPLDMLRFTFQYG